MYIPSFNSPSSPSIGTRLPTAMKTFAQKNAVKTAGDQADNPSASAAATVFTIEPDAEKKLPSHLPSFAPARSQTFPPPNGQVPRRTMAPRK
jgi:hypothetical protein